MMPMEAVKQIAHCSRLGDRKELHKIKMEAKPMAELIKVYFGCPLAITPQAKT